MIRPEPLLVRTRFENFISLLECHLPDRFLRCVRDRRSGRTRDAVNRVQTKYNKLGLRPAGRSDARWTKEWRLPGVFLEF